MSGVRPLRVALLATLMALGGLAAPARAAITIGFDPNGALPGIGTLQVGTFDPGPANAIAVNFNKPAAGGGLRLPNPGETFTLLYQGTIDLLKAADGTTNVWSAGISNGGNTGTLTIVAELTEQIISATATSATFATVPGGSMRWYFNPANNAANAQTGTGFVGPTQIYNGTFLAGPNGTFAVNTQQGIGPLDQSPDNINFYPAISSIAGSGGTSLRVQTTASAALPLGYDPTFFTSAPPANLLVQLFNTSNILPYNQVNPAALFFNGTPGATVASVGTVNGGLVNGQPAGPNVMFQSDANASFELVPEPGTIQMAMTALGLVSLGGLRAYRRRSRSVTA